MFVVCREAGALEDVPATTTTLRCTLAHDDDWESSRVSTGRGRISKLSTFGVQSPVRPALIIVSSGSGLRVPVLARRDVKSWRARAITAARANQACTLSGSFLFWDPSSSLAALGKAHARLLDACRKYPGRSCARSGGGSAPSSNKRLEKLAQTLCCVIPALASVLLILCAWLGDGCIPFLNQPIHCCCCCSCCCRRRCHLTSAWFGPHLTLAPIMW